MVCHGIATVCAYCGLPTGTALLVISDPLFHCFVDACDWNYDEMLCCSHVIYYACHTLLHTGRPKQYIIFIT